MVTRWCVVIQLAGVWSSNDLLMLDHEKSSLRDNAVAVAPDSACALCQNLESSISGFQTFKTFKTR